MSDPAIKPMTSDAFIAWAMEQPSGARYELVAGEVVAMAPERAAHVRLKFQIARRLAEAIEAAGLPCEVFADGLTVAVDDDTLYEPDALVRCGDPLPPDAIRTTDPIIIVEVLSPSTRARDTGAKLEDYFRLPSLQHYLIVKTENGAIIHHQRNPDGTILTRINRGGPLHLDPPGITLPPLLS
jgi:Uma2 family endonuclease